MAEASIAEKYALVEEKIQAAIKRSDRRPDDVHLVVVTKGQTPQKITEAIAAGATSLGENYPEETSQKIEEMGEEAASVDWHMIGHLQSRKIKYVVNNFDMIHSIDRSEIAVALDQKLTVPMNALLEVNLSGEESKGGFAVWDEAQWSKFSGTVAELVELKNLQFLGLMTMPPFANRAEDSRQYFEKCHRLLEFMQKQLGRASFTQLSMGTSIDYEAAIEEGATYVRIGEAIMGPRNYSKTA